MVGFPYLMVGFEGTSLPSWLASRLRDGSVGGVVLFSRNVSDARQVRDLCASVRRAAGRLRPAPLVAIDHEGGRVVRLSHPDFTRFPPARACSRFGGGSEAIAAETGRAMARELRGVGIDVTFSPVLDVDSNPRNPVIGDRAFSSDPFEAAALGIAFAKGTLEGGVVPVGKHFPGHGNTETDSHFEMPVVRSGRALLESRDLLPFRRAIRAGIPALMSAHVLYPALDRKRIATLSPAILETLLREEMEFRGAVFSDALEMKAVADRMPMGDAAVAAALAGCDALLVCRGDEDQNAAAEALVREHGRSAAFRKRTAASLRRISRLRARASASAAGSRPSIRSAGCRAHRELAELLALRWRESAGTSAADRSGSIGEG
jgi:beta-N-acetylhexosaminidase